MNQSMNKLYSKKKRLTYDGATPLGCDACQDSRRLFIHSCSVQHVRTREHIYYQEDLIFVDMGVHDNADSKYIVMGNSSFSKLAPKRPTTVVFNESSSKIQKFEDNQQNVQAENVDKGNISLQQQRKSLPVYKLRKRLLEEIRRNSTLIVIGETGSGKTTQIPQLLLSSGIAGTIGCIGITQPRRVAAVSVARRVAQEQGVEPGKLVGYCVRFEDVTRRKRESSI